jgi:hypothetical protein
MATIRTPSQDATDGSAAATRGSQLHIDLKLDDGWQLAGVAKLLVKSQRCEISMENLTKFGSKGVEFP